MIFFVEMQFCITFNGCNVFHNMFRVNSDNVLLQFVYSLVEIKAVGNMKQIQKNITL